ncbi:NDMA-dependent alcohol dehydrogenase [Nocardioides humi]|uniref:NDMA-dependent alcohol dehydrogenase n=1 Tax=Nocardioides humi TaxID=449461 RepID=A0ABN2ACF5_9ACTN
MLTQGALLWGPGEEWSVEEIRLSDPVDHEVTVRIAACGLCHSEEHFVTGDLPVPHWPILGGHEGSGEIVDVGPGVRRFSVGDRVILSAIPSCGQCRPCLLGYGAICDEGYRAVSGEALADNRRRTSARGEEVAPFCNLGAFAPYVTVHEHSLVKLEKDVPLELAALLGCGVTTGWGAAVNVAEVRAGETVVVLGLGGVGAAAVLGAVGAGAERVIVVDPVASKRELALGLGATHFFVNAQTATEAVREETWGVMAEKVIITVGRMEGALLQVALEMTSKLGVVVPVSSGDVTEVDAKLNVTQLRGYLRSVKGVLLGGGSPKRTIARLVDLYAAGQLPLERLVTARYPLADINRGYDDMRAGRNLRGLLVFDGADR